MTNSQSVAEKGTDVVSRPPRRFSARNLAESYTLVALLVLLGAFFAVLPKSRDVFLSTDNLSVLLGNQATVALLALLCAGLMSRHHLPLGVACLLCLLLGAVIGLVNGVLVTRYRLSSFVTTLAAATLLGGIIQWYTGGQTILAGISPALVQFGSETLLGIPKVVYVVVVVAVLLWYLLSQTPYGRSLYAIGANPKAARLVGVRSDRYVALSFVLAGSIAAVVGILQLARTGSATADSGSNLLFPALAAAFLGATAVRPGFFNVVGTIIGVLFVSVAVSGLTLAGASAWVSPVFNGAALLAAVGLSTYLGRHRGRAE
jgi:ribose transport system permease protein